MRIVAGAAASLIDKTHVEIFDAIAVEISSARNVQSMKPFIACEFEHPARCLGRRHFEIGEGAQCERSARPERTPDAGQVEFLVQEYFDPGRWKVRDRRCLRDSHVTYGVQRQKRQQESSHGRQSGVEEGPF